MTTDRHVVDSQLYVLPASIEPDCTVSPSSNRANMDNESASMKFLASTAVTPVRAECDQYLATLVPSTVDVLY